MSSKETAVNHRFDIDGRLALVTGSSRGIGFALASGLAEAGARVILHGRDTIALDDAAERLRVEFSSDVFTAAFDVTDPSAVSDGVAVIEDRWGTPDILVNNAGIQRRAPFVEFADADWNEVIAANLTSAFLVGRAVARRMIARGSGKIVNIASVQSELARPGIAPYTATKGAIRNLTRGMATDWAKYGLQINAIAPGYFKTPLNQALVDSKEFSDWLEKRTPAGRWGNVEELVGAVVFLSSAASSFVNGQTLFVDGGITASV